MIRLQDDDEEEDGNGIPLLKSKGMMLSFPKYLRQAISGLSDYQIPPPIENQLRLMVRKEVEHAVSRFFCPSPRSLPSKAHKEGCLQLRLVGRLPSTIFTESKILADDGCPIRIELWDTRTNRIVRAGALSTIKIQIVPLKGDFGSGDEEKNWNEGEFSANVVHPRQGKRPLIVGEKSIALQEGVADVVGFSFTDNSSWTWSRHFRLGARTDPMIPHQEWIKAAISSRFMVKDRRGDLYKKHYPPSLNDEVWRLNKIAKDKKFHLRLVSRGISTVKEFLCWLEIDPTSLRKILGSKVPNKVWNAIVEHAVSCQVNTDVILYGPSTSSQHHCYNEVEAPCPFINPPVQPPVMDAWYAGVELWPGQKELETAPLFQSSMSMPGNTWTLGSEAEPAAAHHLSRLNRFGAHIPTYKKRGGGWCKIRAAVTFRSLRRAATARRRAKSTLCGNNRGHCCHPNLGNQYL